MAWGNESLPSGCAHPSRGLSSGLGLGPGPAAWAWGPGSWPGPERLLGPPGGLLGPPGPPGGLLGPSGGLLGPPGTSWGPRGSILGASWGLLGASWGSPGGLLGPPRGLLGASGGFLGTSWRLLGASCPGADPNSKPQTPGLSTGGSGEALKSRRSGEATPGGVKSSVSRHPTDSPNVPSLMYHRECTLANVHSNPLYPPL